ncbi:ammonium transporter [Stackebrandtia endophytica]|uniref:Ammonium transporter n=1 Tax=Stackebrandtia endophytica TaxID=1496996 RepID=A0A543B1S8_9ACTN|nr:ammonium transporter [Stackebrandtia endophytica]TQL78690.1 ammonium transporter [Stackebrandtia endophytica]
MSVNTGNTAWVLASAAMVLLMTPGLALFYGGMTRAKSVINMMMKSLAALAIVSVLWVLIGYSLAFTEGNPLIGGLSEFGLRGLTSTVGDGGLPDIAFAGFQLMFAGITVALISGAVADRMKFTAWIVFTVGWAAVVYFPVAHWVWGGGFIGADWGALDFAGGTAVHANAGAAALALAIVIGRRIGWPRPAAFVPHNVPLVLLGTGLLWFGWFGFNAGSALAANGTAGLALVNTQVAAAAGILAWLAIERLRGRRPCVLAACSGAVTGLVAITPACAFVEPVGAMAIGVVAGAVCPLAVALKERLGYDDSLDVVGIHLVAGAIGSILIGLLAVPELAGRAGLLYGGGIGLTGIQAGAVAVVVAYSFGIAMIIGMVVKYTIGIRVAPEVELAGIDVTEHAENAYDLPMNGGLLDEPAREDPVAVR